MSLLQALRAFVLAGSGVSGLLGDAQGGVHVAQVPMKAPRPYVVLDGLDSPGELHLGGASDRERALVQFECCAPTREEAVALASALKARLHGYRGALDVSVYCLEAKKTAERGPDLKDLQDGGQDHAFSVQLDFAVWHHPRPA